MGVIEARVPATSANLGSGFDCLGLALSIWNTVTASPATTTRVTVRGEGEDRLATDERSLIYRAVGAAFAARGSSPPPLRLECDNRIPVARGLGSSSSAIAAGLLIGNTLMGGPLTPPELIRIGTSLEGHPDNIVPCLLGGIQVSVADRASIVTCPVTVPDRLGAVIFVPNFPLRTEEARAALPRQVLLRDAVFNVGRAALFVAAMERGDLDLLRVATEDALHQPPRTRLFPALPALIRAAVEAGAHGAFLSGAGSSVLALASAREDKIAQAMANAASREGIAGITREAAIDPQGATVTEQ